jgi:hypothetical protein
MKSRIAEWILAQVLPPDRALSTVGDWMEDVDKRGNIWFWSCVFRTVLSRAWSDFAERPGFMVGLALRGWLYSWWLVVGTCFGLFVGICILVGVALLAGFLAHQINWHPSWPFHLPTQIPGAVFVQVWIGWCEFQAGRWIGRRAPGRELAAGIAACLTPIALLLSLRLLAMHFWGGEINLYMASHPYNPNSVPMLLPSEIFLLTGILWSRHKFLRSVAQ